MKTVTGLGAKGVQLFYFISAFTLFLSFYNKGGTEKNTNKNFFIRRLFRIAPLYFLGILYYSIIIPVYENSPIHSKGILLNFFLVHGFSPQYINSIVPGGWSIATEVLFYTFVPILALKINSLNKALIALVISLLVKLAFDLILRNNPFNVNDALWTDYLYWYLPNQMPSFIFGIIFYFVTIQTDIRKTFTDNAKFFLSIFAILIALFLLDKTILKANLINYDFLFGICFLAIAIVIQRFPSKILVNRFTILTGKLSFSMYLIHFAVIYWLEKILLENKTLSGSSAEFILGYGMVLLLTLFISYFSHRFIEIPFQNLGKYFITRSEGRNV